MKGAERSRVGFLVRTLFQSLIRIGGFHWSARSLEEIAPVNISGNDNYDYQRIRAAWLREERQKAKAIEWGLRTRSAY